MHRHNKHLRGVSRELKRANARILQRENSDNPFPTPPEAFVKDQPDLYQLSC